jgi:hypothetical protein
MTSTCWVLVVRIRPWQIMLWSAPSCSQSWRKSANNRIGPLAGTPPVKLAWRHFLFWATQQKLDWLGKLRQWTLLCTKEDPVEELCDRVQFIGPFW